jgi:type IV pilus assembly protein PilM
VKVAQVQERRRGVRAVRCAEEMLPAGFHWEPSGDRAPLVAAIRAALQRAGIRAGSAVLALPRRHVTARISAFPPADRGQLQRVVEYDLADHLPFPVEQVVADFQALGPSREQPGLSDVLVAAAPRELVRQYLDLARDLGLRVAALTVDALALHDLTRQAGAGPPGLTITLDIGRRSTTVNVAQGSRLRLTRSVGTSGQQLAAAVRDDLGVSAEEAERRVQAEGVALLQSAPRPTRVAAWVENLAGEVRRSALSFGEAVISRLLLVGAGARIPGLGEALGRELAVAPAALSVSSLFPQAVVRTGSGQRPEETRAADRCLLAVGVALRGVGLSAWGISLLPRELMQLRRRRLRRLAGAVAAVVLLVGLGIGYAATARGVARDRAQVKLLSKQTETAEAEAKKVEDLVARRDLLRSQARVLESARRRRYVALELLKTISEAAPPEVRLTRFSAQADQLATIAGAAPDSATVANLEAALANSPLVKEASVEHTMRTSERSLALRGPRGVRRAGVEAPAPPSGPEQVSFSIRLKLRVAYDEAERTRAAGLAGGRR